MCCHVTQTKHVYAYFCGVKYSMWRCQRNLKPNDKMKKKFSDTITINRGVGDQRIRNMEANEQKIAKAIDTLAEEIEQAAQDIQDRDPIAFVTAIPASPDAKTLYFVVEDEQEAT